MARCEYADRQQAPRAADAVHGDRPDGVVHLQHELHEVDARYHDDARKQPDHDGGPRVHVRARRRYSDETRQSAVRPHLDVRLARPDHGDVDRRYRAGRAGQERVHRVQAQRVRVDVEPEPPEEQDERPNDHVGHVVPLQVFAFTEALSRPDDDRPRERQEAAHHVHHARPGVVREAGPDLRQPALVAPCPVAVDRVHQRAHDEAVREVGVDLRALRNRARDDRRRRPREHHLEEPGDKVGVLEVQQEEPLQADDARRRSPAHHQRVAERPESQRRYAKVEERLGHVVDRVLGPDQPRAEKGESRLHEEHEHGGDNEDQVVELRVDVARRDLPLRVGHADRAEEDSYAQQRDHRQPQLRGRQTYRFCQCVHCRKPPCNRKTHPSATQRLYPACVASVLPFCYISVTDETVGASSRLAPRGGSSNDTSERVGGGAGSPVSGRAAAPSRAGARLVPQ